MSDHQAQDPLEFVKNMWGNMGFPLPGIVTPTLDTNELDKRINELKTVEGWLKSNLGLLQMTIHSLEMQRTTIAAMQAMSESTSGGEGGNANPFMNPALWPWPFMGQTANPAAQAQPAQTAAPAEAPAEPKKSKPAKPAE